MCNRTKQYIEGYKHPLIGANLINPIIKGLWRRLHHRFLHRASLTIASADRSASYRAAAAFQRCGDPINLNRAETCGQALVGTDLSGA
jgi:hypothetical protein